MPNILRLNRLVRPGNPGVDPVSILLRLDAACRHRRQCQDLTQRQLEDVGLTRHDLERTFRRDG